MAVASNGTTPDDDRDDGHARPALSRRGFLAGAGLGVAGTTLGVPTAAQSAGSSTSGSVLDYPEGPFRTSTSSLTDRVNEFWAVYGTAQGTPHTQGALQAGVLTTLGANPAWDEWDTLKFGWTAHRGFRDTLIEQFASINHINGVDGTVGAQPEGYVWSWTSQETWPDDNDFHDGAGSYHVDQIPRFVIGVRHLAMWTRDRGFLRRMLPRAEFVMERYLLSTMRGREGVLTNLSPTPNGTASDGTAAGRPDNYMDEMRSGHQDAWVNGAFYTALLAMAELETLAGQDARASRYHALARAFPRRYREVFWNDATGRYAGWVDATGDMHDYGLTFVNLEAVARGLADEEHAVSVFEFLRSPTQPTSGTPKPACAYPASAHPGSETVYQDVFAPRTSTRRLPDSAWDGWSDAACGRRPYGAGTEEGGTFLWLSYYDVLARLRYLDADAAMRTFATMLARMHADSQRLTLWSDRIADDFGEVFVEIATNSPFPESGIAVLALLHEFLGVDATPAGLQVAPSLPKSLLCAAAAGVTFGQRELTVDVERAQSVTEQADSSVVASVDHGVLTSAAFRPAGPFNEVGILVSGPVPPAAPGRLTITLQREDSRGWHIVQTRCDVPVVDQSWLVVDVPEQRGHDRYRISVAHGSAGTGWYRSAAGELTFRAIQAPHRPIGTRLRPRRHGPIRFDTERPFDRLVLDCDGPGFTAVLSRLVGNRWHRRHEQRLANGRDGQAVMGFASQQPGSYQLEIVGGPARIRSLEQEQYTLTIPQLRLHARIPAGDHHTVRLT